MPFYQDRLYSYLDGIFVSSHYIQILKIGTLDVFIFDNLSWDGKDININGKYLKHLRFFDDILLMSSGPDLLKSMIKELHSTSTNVGFKMNIPKTNILIPDDVHIYVQNQALVVVNDYIYLDHNIKLCKENQATDFSRRLELSCAAFRKLSCIIPDNVDQTQDKSILILRTYISDLWTGNCSACKYHRKPFAHMPESNVIKNTEDKPKKQDTKGDQAQDVN